MTQPFDAAAATAAYRNALEVIGAVEPTIAGAIKAELADQRSSLKLIASENYASPATLLTMGNWLSDKYAEGTIGRRFYAGCQNVDTVESVAAEHAKELGIAGRVTLREVDVAEAASYGHAEFDLAVVANMLHLFDPVTNAAVLTKTAAALAPGGRVLVHEIVPDDERRRAAYPLMFAVELLLRTTRGTAYTLPEITGWLTEAGFERVEHHAAGYLASITARKP
jgi:hypothetical protein